MQRQQYYITFENSIKKYLADVSLQVDTDEIEEIYNELLETAKRYGYMNSPVMKSFKKEIDEFNTSGTFILLIAGEAKSGKSTFINACLGTEILPMDVRQCTSSIVEIMNGAEFYLEAYYADANKKKTRIDGEENIHQFLVDNATIDDCYRDIPVTTILNSLIIPKRNQPISNGEIEDLIDNVRNENIHHLSEQEYADKIHEYVKKRHEHWNEIVTRIIIHIPYPDQNMRGIHIIDSPGVNAAGRVGEVTESYIQKADAIIFVRPIAGSAIESLSFKNFFEEGCKEKNNKNIFLLLTRTASESDESINEAIDEYKKMYPILDEGNGLGTDGNRIISVDSKAQLYYNRYKDTLVREIEKDITKLHKERGAEPFIFLAWLDSSGNKDEFLKYLKKISRFDNVSKIFDKLKKSAMLMTLSKTMDDVDEAYQYMIDDIDRNINETLLYIDNIGNKNETEKIEQAENRLIAELNAIYNESYNKFDAQYIINEYKDRQYNLETLFNMAGKHCSWSILGEQKSINDINELKIFFSEKVKKLQDEETKCENKFYKACMMKATEESDHINAENTSNIIMNSDVNKFDSNVFNTMWDRLLKESNELFQSIQSDKTRAGYELNITDRTGNTVEKLKQFGNIAELRYKCYTIYLINTIVEEYEKSIDIASGAEERENRQYQIKTMREANKQIKNTRTKVRQLKNKLDILTRKE